MVFGHHHARETGLHRLRHQGLEHRALERHADPGRRHHDACMARGDDGHLLCLDEALGGVDADDAIALAANRGHLAVLNDVDAQGIGRTGEAPGDGIVPGGAAATLQGRTQHGIAQAIQPQRRAERLRLLGCQPLIVDAVQPVGMNVPLRDLHIVHRVRQHQNAARTEHHIVVEVLRQALPQLEGVVVERRTLVVEVVRPADRGVAARVAAAEPTPLDDRDIRHAVLFGEIVRGGETMTAGTDDDHVVGGLGLWTAPLPLPARVAGQRIAGERKDRETLHQGSVRLEAVCASAPPWRSCPSLWRHGHLPASDRSRRRRPCRNKALLRTAATPLF